MSAKDAKNASFEPLKFAKETLIDMWNDGKAEGKRLGTQGSMELASMLFSGHGFVPYGPGQYTPSQEQQHQQDRGIER